MRKIQGKNIFGYALVLIEGNRPEIFFEQCAKQQIVIWDIRKVSTSSCLAKVSWFKLEQVKELAEEYSYHVTVKKIKGLLPMVFLRVRKTDIVIAAVLSLLLIFALTNMVWKLEVTGVSKEVDVEIREELEEYGLYPGAWSLSLENLDVIQQQLLNDIPELLYIGIYKNGTTYQVDAIEKLVEKKEKQESNRQLKASKNGVIEKMFVQSGIPKVHAQDFVKKGDTLVSGVVELDTDDEEEKDNKWIGAKGKVYANTWYEIDITIPIYSETEKLTGNMKKRYGLQTGNVSLPIWGFWHKEFEHSMIEKNNSTFRLFTWDLPISFWQEVIYDKNTLTNQLTEEEAKEMAIRHLSEDLPRQLGADAEILNYKVLHQSVDSGKVNLNLYISVLEDIAIGQETD